MSELKPCPFCGEPADDRYNRLAKCSNKSCLMNHWVDDEDFFIDDDWNTRPIENALLARAEKAEKMVERLMRMVEDRFVLLGNSLDGHLQDCNCAVFLSSRMERDAWSELCYEWHGIYSDWQSANGHQAGKVSENEGSEG